MNFQIEMYRHLIDGHAGEAAPILAKLSLCLGYDAAAYPCSIWDIHAIGSFCRASNTKGLNEFFAMECARSAVLGSFKQWDHEQIVKLREIAALPIPPRLSERFPI